MSLYFIQVSKDEWGVSFRWLYYSLWGNMMDVIPHYSNVTVWCITLFVTKMVKQTQHSESWGWAQLADVFMFFILSKKQMDQQWCTEKQE